MGRPSDYNEEIAALVCERVATITCGLAKMCDMYDDMPTQSTVNLWRYRHPEFSAQYALAKLKQADLLAEECLDISDDNSRDIKYDKDGNESCNSEFVQRSRLRIDTRKWLASKLLPKAYGDRKADDDVSIANTLIEKLLEKK